MEVQIKVYQVIFISTYPTTKKKFFPETFFVQLELLYLRLSGVVRPQSHFLIEYGCQCSVDFHTPSGDGQVSGCASRAAPVQVVVNITAGICCGFDVADGGGIGVHDVYGRECRAEKRGGGAVGTLHTQFKGIVSGGNVGGNLDVLAQYIVIVCRRELQPGGQVPDEILVVALYGIDLDITREVHCTAVGDADRIDVDVVLYFYSTDAALYGSGSEDHAVGLSVVRADAHCQTQYIGIVDRGTARSCT